MVSFRRAPQDVAQAVVRCTPSFSCRYCYQPDTGETPASSVLASVDANSCVRTARINAFRHWQPRHGSHLKISDMRIAIESWRLGSKPKSGIHPKWIHAAALVRKARLGGKKDPQSLARQWRKLKERRLPPETFATGSVQPATSHAPIILELLSPDSKSVGPATPPGSNFSGRVEDKNVDRSKCGAR